VIQGNLFWGVFLIFFVTLLHLLLHYLIVVPHRLKLKAHSLLHWEEHTENERKTKHSNHCPPWRSQHSDGKVSLSAEAAEKHHANMMEHFRETGDKGEREGKKYRLYLPAGRMKMDLEMKEVALTWSNTQTKFGTKVITYDPSGQRRRMGLKVTGVGDQFNSSFEQSLRQQAYENYALWKKRNTEESETTKSLPPAKQKMQMKRERRRLAQYDAVVKIQAKQRQRLAARHASGKKEALGIGSTTVGSEEGEARQDTPPCTGESVTGVGMLLAELGNTDRDELSLRSQQQQSLRSLNRQFQEEEEATLKEGVGFDVEEGAVPNPLPSCEPAFGVHGSQSLKKGTSFSRNPLESSVAFFTNELHPGDYIVEINKQLITERFAQTGRSQEELCDTEKSTLLTLLRPHTAHENDTFFHSMAAKPLVDIKIRVHQFEKLHPSAQHAHMLLHEANPLMYKVKEAICHTLKQNPFPKPELLVLAILYQGEWDPSVAKCIQRSRSIQCLTCADLLLPLSALGSHPHDISVGSSIHKVHANRHQLSGRPKRTSQKSCWRG
jgi:hypothetical protein